MDAANRDAYIHQWVEQVKESNYTEKVLDRGQNFCPSPQTLDSSFASIASAPPLYQYSSQDHPRHFIPSGAHQKLVRSISSQPLSEHKPTTVSRVKNQSPVPSEVPPHHDLPSWDLAVAPNASPRKPLKLTNQSGGGIAKGIKDTPSTTEGTSSTINGTPSTTEGTSSTINGTPSTTEGTSSTIKGTPSTISSTTHDGSSAGPCGFPESILYREKPQLIAHPFTADTRAASPHTPLSICHAGLKDLRTPNYKEGGTPAKEEHKGHVRQYCVSSHQHQYGCSSESFNTNIRFLSKRSISAQFMVPEPKQLSPSFKPSPICGVNSTHCYTPNGAHPS